MTRQLPWAVKPSNKTTAERSRATASPSSVTSRTPSAVDRAKTPHDASPRVFQSPLSVDGPSRRSLGTKSSQFDAPWIRFAIHQNLAADAPRRPITLNISPTTAPRREVWKERPF